MLQAQVDVNLLVTSIKSHETQIGEWVNVMGYITGQQKKQAANRRTSEVSVQAIVLWSAGPFNLQAYEKSFVEKQQKELMKHP